MLPNESVFLVIRTVAPLLAALALSACTDDRSSQVGKCGYEAQKAFPTAQLSTSVDMGRMIKACMRAGGYQYDRNLEKCSASPDTETNVRCYRPAE